MYSFNTRSNPWHLMTAAQVGQQSTAANSGDLTGLLHALASQTAQTQAMLTALLNQHPVPSAHSSNSPDALMKALLEKMQPPSEPQHASKRPRISSSSLSSSSSGNSSCTSPTLDSDFRSSDLSSSPGSSDDFGKGSGSGIHVGGSIDLASGWKSSPPAGRCLKRPSPVEPLQKQAPIRHFPATCSLLSGVGVVQGTTSAAPTTSSTTTNNASAVATDTLRRAQPKTAACDAAGLAGQTDSRQGQYELLVTAQPELNHRARYLTEGSRGAVKDRSQLGYPSVQLVGWSQPVELCVYVATDSGKVKPHGYYQICRVAGRHGCCEAREVVQEGARMLVIPVNPSAGQPISLDCIGILKLRNSDVDSRQQTQPCQPSTKLPSTGGGSKRSSKVRLVVRAFLPVGDGGAGVTLQTVTQPIDCTQPAGQPEIHRLSAHEGSPVGGGELFIIGKNFGKSARVVFAEAAAASTVGGRCRGSLAWQADAAIESEFSAANHLVCRVPEFDPDRRPLASPVEVMVTVQCGDRASESVYFTYAPELPAHASHQHRHHHSQLQQQQHLQHPHHLQHLQDGACSFLDLGAHHHHGGGVGGMFDAFLTCDEAGTAATEHGLVGHW